MGTVGVTPDYIEAKTDELLRAARRSRWYKDILGDAEWFHREDGYAWDVALAISCEYWLS